MFNPQIPLTTTTKSGQTTLYILFAIGMFLSICKFSILQLALNEILTNILLLCSAICLNYCILVFYIILLIFNTLTIFQIIGIQFQKSIFLNANFFEGGNPEIFIFVIILFTFFFNLISVWICYSVYKKFKTVFVKGPASRDLSVPMTDVRNGSENFTPFKGDGVKIG